MRNSALTTRAEAPALPRLADLDAEGKQKIFREAVRGRLVKEMDRQIDALSVDFNDIVKKFLAVHAQKSPETARRYANAVRKWQAWCDTQGVHPLLAEPMHADLFAKDLAGAPASVNSAISSVSSLYSTLVKWRVIAQTPFIKINRRAEAPSEHMIPSAKEIQRILEEI